jgi:hypothetical protein
LRMRGGGREGGCKGEGEASADHVGLR